VAWTQLIYLSLWTSAWLLSTKVSKRRKKNVINSLSGRGRSASQEPRSMELVNLMEVWAYY